MSDLSIKEIEGTWCHVSFSGRRPARRRRPSCGTPTAGTPAGGASSAGRERAADVPLDPFVAWVLAGAGLDLEAYRPAPLNRRLSACLRALRCGSTEEARALLLRRPELLDRAVDALLIGVTSFGRDPHVFDALARLALPRLEGVTDGLRVWSAGCANGAELYSVALLLDAAGMLRHSHLLGTDCRAAAVAAARRARYDASVLGPFSGAVESGAFETEGTVVRPGPALRAVTRWKAADVTRQVEEGPWHVVLCRNLAIYLSPAAVARLWVRLVEQITPGGLLVTGKADPRPPGMERLTACLYLKS